MKLRQKTPNTRGKEGMPPARTYPFDGLPVAGHPLMFRMRSGSAVYGVNRNGSIVRVGQKGGPEPRR